MVRLLSSADREGKASTEAKRLIELAGFDVEVGNGGLLQYFTNPRGINHSVVRSILLECGLHRHELILQRWLNLLPAGVDPSNRNEVGVAMFSKADLTNASRALDQEFFRIKDEFYEMTVRWALKVEV